MSKLEVDAIEPQSGTTLTIGASGDTVALGSGASVSGLTLSDNILFNTASKGIYLGVTTATASNLLDDYEEGTWTPTFSGHTGVTYTAQVGEYTKIGNICTVRIQLGISNYTGTTGSTLSIAGLPFATIGTGGAGNGGAVIRWNGINLSSGYTSLSLMAASPSGTTLDAYESGDNNSSAFLSPSTLSTSGGIFTIISYFTT